jgi:predicted metalloprotease with PDZ domain
MRSRSNAPAGHCLQNDDYLKPDGKDQNFCLQQAFETMGEIDVKSIDGGFPVAALLTLVLNCTVPAGTPRRRTGSQESVSRKTKVTVLTRLKSTVFRFSILCCATTFIVAGAATVDAQEPIRILVDATDTVHKAFSVTEFIPLQGETSITLLYPRWEISSHAPTISVADLAGLELRINGKPQEWHRDPVDINAFHISLPSDASVLEAHFQYLSPLNGGVMSHDIVQVPWQHLMLYPQGMNVNDIPVLAQLRLPGGFHAASSLRAEKEDGTDLDFRQCTIGELADAPVFAGRFMREWPLSKDDAKPVWLHVVADEAQDLAISPEQLETLRRTVALTNSMFGAVPFRHYDFLVSLTNRLPNDGGNEHQESSEISLPADYFLKPDRYKAMASLFPHEYIHAWNGLAHRPAGLVVPDFNTPMQDSMLWVYEGLTELWGLQIARDSGLISDQDYRDLLAIDAAEQLSRPGRQWKSLADSDYDPVYLAGHHITWRDWERREDYYTEGPLLWLGVDAQIRRSTEGKKTLKDFARAFFAPCQTPWVVEAYTFPDLIAALNAIAAFSWQDYILVRLNAHDETHLLEDLKASCYRLVFSATESALLAQEEQEEGVLDLSYSIGARIRQNGVVQDVSWNGSAFEAGVVPGTKITAIDGEGFSFDALRRRIEANSTARIRLTVKNEAGEVEEISFDYRAGLRFPHLEGNGH